MNEYGSFSKETAEVLNINTSTLRRWSIELEKHGYVIERNEKDQRIYYKRDIIAFRQLQKMISEKVSMVDACTRLTKEYNNKKELEQTLSVHEEKSAQLTFTEQELEALIERSVERAIEKERDAMFKAFENKMNDVIETRDRHLVNQLNQSMEQKRLEIAAAKEDEQKKGFWSRLFNK